MLLMVQANTVIVSLFQRKVIARYVKVVLRDILYVSQLDVIHTVKHAQVPQAHAQQDSIFAAQPKSSKISTLRLDQNSANSVYSKDAGTVQSSSEY